MRSICLLIALAIGCNSESSDEGELGARCYPNGTCDVTLACAGGICVSSPVDGGVDSSTDAFIPSDAFVCIDMALEPNETIQTATGTGVGGSMSSITFAGLAICQTGDRDTFRVTVVTASYSVEAVVTYTAGSSMSVSILNAGGTAINNGTPNGANSLRAFVPNLPVGTYYVQVAGSVGGMYSVMLRSAP